MANKNVLTYFTNRWQGTKVNNSFSDWSKLEKGEPQGSFLGSVLFNVFLNDLLQLNGVIMLTIQHYMFVMTPLNN